MITVALRPLVTVETHRYVTSAVTSAVATAAGVPFERTIPLPGGVMVTKRGSGDVWSYPNIHGDVQAVANTAGIKQGATLTYDPYGSSLVGSVDNMAGQIDNGWLGQHQRPIENATGLNPTIQMGARPYNPTLGRFLRVDPVEGGNSNDYIYPTDPINEFDITGMCGTFGNPFKKCKDKNRKDKGFVGGVFSKSGRAVKGAAVATYNGGIYLGSHLGTGVTGCLATCVSAGTKAGLPFVTVGGSGYGVSGDVYVFQGDACAQSGWGASASVVAGYGGGSTVSLSDGKPVEGTSGMTISAGGKVQYGGGTSWTYFLAGC